MGVRRVFILGAGFSKQAGIPLATELTPLLLDKFKNDGNSEMLEWFEWLANRAKWLEQAGGVSRGLNIEQVFELAKFDTVLWKMRQHRCSLGRNAGDTPHSVAESIESWLSYMEYDLTDVILCAQEQAEQKMESVKEFSRHLCEDDVVLTFNYDTLLEKSFNDLGKPWSYGFDGGGEKGTTILKMHGSINWKISPRNTSSPSQLLYRKEDLNVTDHGSQAPKEPEYQYELVRVPDAKVKQFISNRDIQWSETYSYVGMAGLGAYKELDVLPGSGVVWHKAGRSLFQTEETYVVGFSLSPFDTMARLHFAGVMLERSQKKKLPESIHIVDPNAADLQENFRSVFGSDIAVFPHNCTAEDMNWEKLLC